MVEIGYIRLRLGEVKRFAAVLDLIKIKLGQRHTAVARDATRKKDARNSGRPIFHATDVVPKRLTMAVHVMPISAPVTVIAVARTRRVGDQRTGRSADHATSHRAAD